MVGGLLPELLFDDLDRALVSVLMPKLMGGVSACRWVMLVQATLLDLFGLDRDLGPPEELAENECALVEVRKASLLLQHGGSCKSHHLFHLWFRLFV